MEDAYSNLNYQDQDDLHKELKKIIDTLRKKHPAMEEFIKNMERKRYENNGMDKRKV